LAQVFAEVKPVFQAYIAFREPLVLNDGGNVCIQC